MHKHRLQQMQALARVRGLAEQRAELVTQQAAQALRHANDLLQEANDRVDAATRWKAGSAVAAGLRLGLYEQALVSEQVLSVAAESADSTRSRVRQAHEQSREQLLQASRALEVAQRRLQRGTRAAADAMERKQSDDAADLWLSRKLHADR
ncbi:MAG TPA: hypothetical protein DDZ67_09055 [Xanthomonadaceae bacterium]|nr:hypothetical protein [Xanthomonadaceae bacterium]